MVDNIPGDGISLADSAQAEYLTAGEITDLEHRYESVGGTPEGFQKKFGPALVPYYANASENAAPSFPVLPWYLDPAKPWIYLETGAVVYALLWLTRLGDD